MIPFELIVDQKNKKEEFLQEYLYVEDTYLEPLPKSEEKKEEIERGVIIIDMF